MSKISAEFICDSINEFGNRLTTMKVTFPRFILAELNTHRMFSRNSASSRAIPFEKMVNSVMENPFIPIAWQKDHKGMQGTEYFATDSVEASDLHDHWLEGRDWSVKKAKSLSERNLTKQLCNRLLEPFMWHTVLITATEFSNFFKLRCPQYEFFGKIYRSKKDVFKEMEVTEEDLQRQNKGQAEIHMMALAEAMWDAMNESTPKQLKAGEWHIPFKPEFLTYKEGDQTISYVPNPAFPEEIKDTIKVAVANCARVSYTTVGEESKERLSSEDIKLYNRLLESGHLSPFEHVGRAMSRFERRLIGTGNVICDEQHVNEFQTDWSGNFRGFIQYRKELETKI